MNPRMSVLVGRVLSCAVVTAWIPLAGAAQPEGQTRKTHIRMGYGRSIVAVKTPPATSAARAVREDQEYQFPRPRLAGFSPLVAITTSNKWSENGLDFEHNLEGSFVGTPLNPPANRNFVIGVFDSGAEVNLIAGGSAETLGVEDEYLSGSPFPIGGVGGTVDAELSEPIGVFTTGLSAVDENGTLDLSAVVGHSNVSTVVTQAIVCGGEEVVSAVIGMPLLSFYNTIISVDLPRAVIIGGETFTSPDVRIQDQSVPLPQFAHEISIEFGGLLPATTASYYSFVEGEGSMLLFPTLMSTASFTFPLGGVFFATIYVLEGEPGPTNPVLPLRVLVDTGAQSSIISPGAVRDLSLPLEPDFTVDVCGVGGLVTDVEGFYIDYVKINAGGGPLEFSQAPFVVLDLQSPEGGPLDGVLGMNFFWNRNVILQPALTAAAVFHVSEPIRFAYGDFDLDLDVDAADVSTFVSCVTGTGTAALDLECEHIDADRDGDVDLADFAHFQLCFSGSDGTADPDCVSDYND